MAIDSYAKLQSSIADAANRDDLFDDVTAYSPSVIDGMVKRSISNATLTISRDLAARGGTGLQEVLSDTLSTAAGVEYVDLPANTSGVKYLGITANPQSTLGPKDFTSLVNDNPNVAPNRPVSFSIVNRTRAYLRPIPDSNYPLRLIIWESLDDLAANVTNPIFAAYPDIYEAAACVELGATLQDDAFMSKWRVIYDQKMNDMTAQDKMLGWAAAISGAFPTVQITIA